MNYISVSNNTMKKHCPKLDFEATSNDEFKNNSVKHDFSISKSLKFPIITQLYAIKYCQTLDFEADP